MYFYHTGQGLVNIGKWKKKEHLEKVELCKLPYDQAQPNKSCPEQTYIPSDLCCTILTKCKGGTCPTSYRTPPEPIPSQPTLKPFKWTCRTGFSDIDIGYESDLSPKIGQTEQLGVFWDDFGNFVILPQDLIDLLNSVKARYHEDIGKYLSRKLLLTGPAGALYYYIFGPPMRFTTFQYASCADTAEEASKIFSDVAGSQQDVLVGWLSWPMNYDPRGGLFWRGIHNWASIYFVGEDWYLKGDPWLYGNKLIIIHFSDVQPIPGY
jgi:hypothetical protein